MESQIKSSVSEKMYANKIRYFERPLSSNTPYPFRVLHAVNPYDFTLGLEDKEGKELEKRLERVLGDYAEELGFIGEGGKKEVELKEDWYYPGMPIMIKDSAGGKPGVLRGEVLEIQGQFLTVLRVDRGGVRSLAKSNALPVTQAVLRVPKLGVVCRMAQIRPEKGDTWPALKEWAKDWSGKTSSLVTLLDYYPGSRSFEVSLEVDKVNVALNYFLTGVALPVELATFEKADGFPFPVNDFSTWMGLKVNVFGTKVFQDKKDDNKVKCVLQMDPEVANKILDEVAAHVNKNGVENLKKIPFTKKVGAACLAPYATDYNRAIILQDLGNGKYIVEYTDYKETSEPILGSELLPIPAELLRYPEAGQVCQITDLMGLDQNELDMEKLAELIQDKDLYAVVDAFDPEMFGPEILVSLFQVGENFNGGEDTPFSELFQSKDRPPVVRDILQTMDWVPESIAKIFLKAPLPSANKLYPGVMVSAINNWDSIWLQFEDTEAALAAISAELAQFYENDGCPQEYKEDCLKMPLVGRCIAAKMPDDPLNLWYRAKVVGLKDQDKLEVLYVDYGNVEEVAKQEVWPLHYYFVKDALLAVQVELKPEF